MLISGTHRKELLGGFQETTNNRMEIMAAIRGIEALKNESDVTLFSDSKYIVNGISKGWAAGWRAKAWKSQNGELRLNFDLWEQLLVLCERHNVDFRWIRGHAGDIENERANRLAAQAAKSENLPVDEGYETGQSASIPEQRGVADNPPTKMIEPGQQCRKCGTPVIRKVPENKKRKPNQTYYFDWYLYCPNCKVMYMVESAKRYL